MAICTVNGVEYEARTGLETWGQLLEILEHGDGPRRVVVTEVRFDGVDEPSFREAPVRARTLASGPDIAVDTCEAGELVASTIAVARQGLEPLAEAARQIADRFRILDVAGASHGLAEFALTLKTLGSITATLRDQAVAWGATGPQAQGTDFLADLGRGLEALIEARSRQDWILVADLLEYEMPGLLVRWDGMLNALGD